MERTKAKKSLIGKKFRDLYVEDEYGVDKHGDLLYECKCVCGRTTYLSDEQLLSKEFKNCGCEETTKQKESSNPDFVKGITFHGTLGKWTAGINTRGRTYHLGTFTTRDDAEARRKEAEERLADGSFVDWFYSIPNKARKTCRSCEHYRWNHSLWKGENSDAGCRNTTRKRPFNEYDNCWERFRYDCDSIYGSKSSKG